MTLLPVTSLYAALLTVMFLVLSGRVIARRRSGGISLGVAGDPDLERAARVHANFAEYVPLGLGLIGLAEVGSAPHWLLHLLGCALLVGRIAHAVGLSRKPEEVRLRLLGMVLTFTVLSVAAALLLVDGLTAAWH